MTPQVTPAPGVTSTPAASETPIPEVSESESTTLVTDPEEGIVTDEVPTVNTPEEATVPVAVPAGGGSSAPGSQAPLWGVALIVLGALGAAGAGSRIASTRKQ